MRLCPLKAVEPKDIDFVVFRENTEGAYVDAGGVFKQGTPDEIAVQENINTERASNGLFATPSNFRTPKKPTEARAGAS